VVCVAVPAAAGRGPARGVVLIDAEGRLRLAMRQAGEAGRHKEARWDCDALQPDPSPSRAPGARIAAGVEGDRVSIFYCSGEERPALCQATWRGPGRWASGRVAALDGGFDEEPVRPRSLAAIFDGKASIAYVSSDRGGLWELKVTAPAFKLPTGRQARAWCMTDHDFKARLMGVSDGPVVAGQLPRSRAEGGGLAGREVVAVRGDTSPGTLLHRFFVGGAGCGALEGRGIDTWQVQDLNAANGGCRAPAIASDCRAGQAICSLATAGGTHHIFYAAAGGVIVEL
jgi:hypothetical protein